jgi:hypothetical protein
MLTARQAGVDPRGWSWPAASLPSALRPLSSQSLPGNGGGAGAGRRDHPPARSGRRHRGGGPGGRVDHGRAAGHGLHVPCRGSRRPGCRPGCMPKPPSSERSHRLSQGSEGYLAGEQARLEPVAARTRRRLHTSQREECAAPSDADPATSGDDVADALGRAVFRVKGGGPLGQLPELAAELLELPDAPIEVGGVTLEQVGDMRAGGLPVVAEGDDLADLAQGEADRLGGADEPRAVPGPPGRRCGSRRRCGSAG